MGESRKGLPATDYPEKFHDQVKKQDILASRRPIVTKFRKIRASIRTPKGGGESGKATGKIQVLGTRPRRSWKRGESRGEEAKSPR